MQPDHEPSASPNALPEQLDDVVPIQKITSRGSAFSKGISIPLQTSILTDEDPEAISLKRGREGSLVGPGTQRPPALSSCLRSADDMYRSRIRQKPRSKHQP